MKLAHIIAGLAAIVLPGGAASAQYVNLTNYGAAFTNRTNTAAQRYFIASERPVASLPSAPLIIRVSGLDAVAGDSRVEWDNPGAALFAITLENAVFSSSVNAASLRGRVQALVAIPPLESAPAASAGCLAADIVVVSGGTVGSNTVTFSIANIAACGRALRFESANGVQLTATNANFSTTLVRQLDNTPINGGSATTHSPTTGAFIQSAPAISFTGNATLPVRPILLPDYTTMGAPSAPFTFTIRSGITPDSRPVHSDLTGTGINAPVATATASLLLADTTGLSIATSGLSGTLFGTGNSITLAAMANIGGTNVNFVTGVSPSVPAAAIRTQDVAIQLVVTFTAASGFAPQTYAPVVVGRLTRQGQRTQVFSWVGDGVTTSAISVFRHTGLGATAPTVRFIVANASAGASFNGEYTIPAGSITNNNGEAVTTSLLLSQVAGNFGRADVTFVFDRAVGTPINTQRFVQSPTGALAAAPQENAVPNNNTAVFP